MPMVVPQLCAKVLAVRGSGGGGRDGGRRGEGKLDSFGRDLGRARSNEKEKEKDVDSNNKDSNNKDSVEKVEKGQGKTSRDETTTAASDDEDREPKRARRED